MWKNFPVVQDNQLSKFYVYLSISGEQKDVPEDIYFVNPPTEKIKF